MMFQINLFMKKEKQMKVNRKIRLKDFHIVDIDENDFKEKFGNNGGTIDKRTR